jgi:hypothetical protein
MYEETVIAPAGDQMFDIPAGLSLRMAIQSIFNFYSNSAKENEQREVDDMENALDGTNFVRMCRDAPELASASRIQRY